MGVSFYIILKTNEDTCNLTVHSRKIQTTYFVRNKYTFFFLSSLVHRPELSLSYSFAAIISHTFTWKDNCYVHAQFTKQKSLVHDQKIQHSSTDRMQMVPCMADI